MEKHPSLRGDADFNGAEIRHLERYCSPESSRRFSRVLLGGLAVAWGIAAAAPAVAQETASAPYEAARGGREGMPFPKYFRWWYQSSLNSPLPLKTPKDGLPDTFGPNDTFINQHGLMGTWNTLGTVRTADNAFFQSLGTNGRTCFSCHRPADGMSISASSLRREFRASRGRDPVFAPVDGANCPNLVPADDTRKSPYGNHRGRGRKSLESAYSLALDKGLFRIFLPMPDNAEFTIRVVSDPYTCNTDPEYATVTVDGQTKQMISVYRRPRMSANLKFMVEATSQGIGVPKNLDVLTNELLTDPATGGPISGNIMWDGREPTLKSQARSATMGHAQALTEPTDAQLQQIVDLETAFFLAQDAMFFAGKLNGPTAGNVNGGPKFMSEQPPTIGFTSGGFALYNAWDVPPSPRPSLGEAQRASIARGQKLFNTKSFSVNNVAGFNNLAIIGNPAQAQCVTCHGTLQAGSEVFARGQRSIGIGGVQAGFGGPPPSRDLPIFEVTCKDGKTMPFIGSTAKTNDPGLALITGRCADVGRTSVPQIRALAGRAPYFSNGSAETATDIVNFYNRRFNIGLTPQDIKDLSNFLLAL